MDFSDLLKQTAVYWGNPVSDGYGGRTFDDPIEIDVRWEDRNDVFIDRSGQEAKSQSVVYVNRDLDVGGYLYLGILNDLASDEEADPLSVDAAFEIRSLLKSPSVKANVFIRKVLL